MWLISLCEKVGRELISKGISYFLLAWCGLDTTTNTAPPSPISDTCRNRSYIATCIIACDASRSLRLYLDAAVYGLQLGFIDKRRDINAAENVGQHGSNCPERRPLVDVKLSDYID